MTVLFTLIIMFVFARYVIKCSSRKSYILTGGIISVVVVLSELNYIITNPMHYLMYEAWQVLLAYIIYLAYALSNTTSIRRNRDFNKKIRKATKPYFNTAKANGLYLIIFSVIILLIGIGLLIIKLTDIYSDIPFVTYIGSVIGFIGFLVSGIVLIKKAKEKFILIVKTDEEFHTFYVDINNKYRFNYMDYIGDIYKYYIIEKLGVIKYVGDLKETHYVWLLNTENLKNYDISKLDMKELDSNLYNELIDEIYKFRNVRVSIKIKNNEIKEMK